MESNDILGWKLNYKNKRRREPGISGQYEMIIEYSHP